MPSNLRPWRKLPSRREERIEVQNHSIRVLRRAFQRSLRLQVKSDGSLLLTAGLSLNQRHLEDFVRQAWPWVEKQRARVKTARDQFPLPQYRQGEKLLFLGKERELRFRSSANQAGRIRIEDQFLWVEVPAGKWSGFLTETPHPEWALPLRRFYEFEGRKILASRAQVFARLTGLYPSKVSFRCQRTRWGSCSSDGKISLNWRLIAAPLAVLDYVVIHELAHLRFGDHSKFFWDLVRRFCPDYREHSRWLKQNHLAMDFLLKPS